MNKPFKQLLAGTALALTLGVFTLSGASALELGVGVNSDVNADVNTNVRANSDTRVRSRTQAEDPRRSSDVYTPGRTTESNRADVNADGSARLNSNIDADTRISNDTRARLEADQRARLNNVSTRGEEMRSDGRRSWWQGDSSVRSRTRAGLND